VPTELDVRIGAQALDILDRSLLEPSKLDRLRQQQLQSLFASMVRSIDDGHDYRLELRASRLGPNALALPSGIVVVTDALVNLADHDEELQAVIAHEIGHVRGRHALRQLIQGAGISVLAVVLLGDVSSISAIASAAPALLQARHSRDLEREADAYARQWLVERGIEPTRFDDILCRMVGQGEGDDPAAFLSTHPALDERARCRRAEQ
jgi:Zn-dependent protease with chaperone function